MLQPDRSDGDVVPADEPLLKAQAQLICGSRPRQPKVCNIAAAGVEWVYGARRLCLSTAVSNNGRLHTDGYSICDMWREQARHV